ncbi:TPA: hypothetical protein ACG0NW_001433 [Enterobacter roggenkampii]|nr:hypothetical protein [Enterobacter roggenkampii]
MSTISKERLHKIKQWRETYGPGSNVVLPAEEAEELARIALASLEAEPVAITDDMAYAFHHAQSDSSLGADEVEEIKAGLRAAFANVTAPPAPVALTSGYSDFEEIWSSSTHPLTQDDEMKDFAWDIWNACRSAMLQGADGNSPVIPDCSCRTCRPVTFSDSRFVVCPECGNKRCPHANDHRNACSGSNEPGQEGSAYPAAPQQEVKNG